MFTEIRLEPLGSDAKYPLVRLSDTEPQAESYSIRFCFIMGGNSVRVEKMGVTLSWVNILERDGWLIVNLEGRKLGMMISVTEGGRVSYGRNEMGWREKECPVDSR